MDKRIRTLQSFNCHTLISQTDESHCLNNSVLAAVHAEKYKPKLDFELLEIVSQKKEAQLDS